MSSKEQESKHSFYSNENGLQKAPPEYRSLVLYLEKKHGVVSECFLDINGFIRCIYLQDSYMKDLFNFYPDRMCMDATYKYFENDIFMYLFLIEDSNGRNFIVSLGFSVDEHPESLTWLLNIFKKHNPNWRRIKIIVIDSEIQQKEVIRNSFPNPYIMMCFYHVNKSFEKGLNHINLPNGVPVEQTHIAMQLFKSMYYANRQSEYELYYQQFLLLHDSIVSYFQEVWIPIQHLWRTGLDFYHENLFNNLNFELESLDSTFKSVYIAENDVLEFIRKSFLILDLKRNEKVVITLYTNSMLYSRFSVEYEISKVITSYAAKFVIDQFDLSSEIHMDCSVIAENYFFDNFGSPVNASASVCSCHFFLYTFLPCRHIFAVRKTLSVCAFNESLVDSCWTMKYFQNSLAALESSLGILPETVLPNAACSKDILISNLLQLTLPIMLESPKSVFETRIKVMKQLASCWKKEKSVYLNFVGAESEGSYVKSDYDFDNCLNIKLLPALPDVYKIESPISSQDVQVESVKKSSSYNQSICEVEIKRKWNFKSKILDGKYINYAYLCRIICETKESCLNWLKQMELIPTTMICLSCECKMVLKKISHLSDGAIWVCPNAIDRRDCYRRCSVRQGSWFEMTNMTLKQILAFCYMWINEYSQNQIVAEVGISITTYVTWNKLNGRVCQEILLEEGKFLTTRKTNSSFYSQFLKMWLKTCHDEDSFLKFLQDANLVHRKETLKHSMY